MNISSRLKRVIEASGLSFTAAAAKCGIPYSSLQNYLRGEREPKVDALVLISTHLGTSLDWLLTGEGQMYKSTPPPDQPMLTLSPKERALLEMFKELSDKDQREICRDAEEKKRTADLERRLKELELFVEQQKNVG